MVESASVESSSDSARLRVLLFGGLHDVRVFGRHVRAAILHSPAANQAIEEGEAEACGELDLLYRSYVWHECQRVGTLQYTDFELRSRFL